MLRATVKNLVATAIRDSRFVHRYSKVGTKSFLSSVLQGVISDSNSSPIYVPAATY